MTMARHVFGALLAMVAMFMAIVIVGTLAAMFLAVIIAGAATAVNIAEARVTGSVENASITTEHTVLGTIVAVIGVWTAIGKFGPQDIAGPLFAVISTVIIVVGVTILRVALKAEPFTSVTGGRGRDVRV